MEAVKKGWDIGYRERETHAERGELRGESLTSGPSTVQMYTRAGTLSVLLPGTVVQPAFIGLGLAHPPDQAYRCTHSTTRERVVIQWDIRAYGPAD